LRVSGDQTLVNLSGDGTSGGVTIKDATTLTVSSSAATTTVFNARLCGAVDLVKDGPGTFAMTGVNALTGAVRVAAGTLALQRPIYREGLVGRWGFEDAANLLRDSGPNGFTLTRNVTGTAPVLFQTNGIDNLRGIHFSAKDPSNAWASNYLRVASWNATAANGFPIGGTPRTWSVWLRPTAKCTSYVYLLRQGSWQTGKEMMLWLRDKNKLRLSIHEYSDPNMVNSIEQSVSGITDGNWHHVVCTYSNKVLQLYYDGQLKEAKATQDALNISDSSDFVIGNNDTRNAASHNYDGGMDDLQVYNRVLTALGDETPDFLAAVRDLTAGACEARNAVLTLPEGIYTQSIGSVMSHPRKGQFPLNLSYRYVKEFDGENDGLVGEGSFAWGERYTLLRTDGKRGISHGDVIDLNRENLRDFDVRDFYVALVRELRERGL
jgi:autotransporter-associated beta strand protein